MIEVLKNTAATLDIVFSSGYADANVTYAVTDQDGASVASGTASKDLSVTGRYYFTLLPQAALKWLVVTWTGTFGGVVQSIATGAGSNDGTAAEVQVTGGHLFTVAQARAFGDGKLANATTYPDETIIDARSRVTVLFEDYCDVAFVPRYGRVVLDGMWGPTAWLPDTKVTAIKAVTVDGTALSGSDLSGIIANPDGKIYRAGYYGFWSGLQPQNVTISYEHGYTATPEPITRAALILARYELTMTNQLADRMISMQNEFGIVRQAIPGQGQPTGIPIVDATLNDYAERVSVF